LTSLTPSSPRSTSVRDGTHDKRAHISATYMRMYVDYKYRVSATYANVSYSRFKNVYRERRISLMCNERKSRSHGDRCLRTVWFISNEGFKKSTHTHARVSRDRSRLLGGYGPKGSSCMRVRTGHG
jgi:hypothetical protein